MTYLDELDHFSVQLCPPLSCILLFYCSQITVVGEKKKFPCSTTFSVHSRLSKDNYENKSRDYRFESNVVFELCIEALVNVSVTRNYFNCCENEFVGTLKFRLLNFRFRILFVIKKRYKKQSAKRISEHLLHQDFEVQPRFICLY